MKILALEPYFGGSHQAFWRGWQEHSRHEWMLLTDRPHHWKWRMRHAAVTFAEQIRRMEPHSRRWDVLVCSEMLNLAEFLGLAGGGLASLPAVVYFHENQWTYPTRHEEPRDVHFGLVHLSTALAAREVWFNSAYHRRDFLDASRQVLRKMPRPSLTSRVAIIDDRSRVESPGIVLPPEAPPRKAGPMRIAWAARWEHDKGPDTFFAAIKRLAEQGVDFRLRVLGEHFREVPEVFARARAEFDDRIEHWGYAPSREEYFAHLGASDVAVSTAEHEFFGLAMLEAAAAGAVPVLPRRLSYPDLFTQDGTSAGFYDGNAESLADTLAHLASPQGRASLDARRPACREIASHYAWPVRAKVMDDRLEALASVRNC